MRISDTEGTEMDEGAGRVLTAEMRGSRVRSCSDLEPCSAERNAASRLRSWGARICREILLGPVYFWHKRLLRSSKQWDQRRQRAYQERRAGALFAHYGREAINSKTDYRVSSARFNRLCVPVLTKVIRTGGTTGTPLAFYMDTFGRRQKERAYLFDIWSEVGYQPFDLRVVYRGNTGKRLISYNWLENCYVFSPSALSRSNREEVLGLLRALPPFFLHVYPSSLFSFIGMLGVEAFSALPIRGVLAGSEVFPSAQRKAFERQFGIRVAHWYGHSEYATLARHCRACDGFHFYPTYGYTEFIPADGALHRIVATSYNRIGTRFVRYDTEDVARLDGVRCAAPFFRAAAIEGRSQEFFIDREGQRRAFGPYLFGIHDEFWDRVAGIQFVQERTGCLQVRIVASPGASKPWLEAYLRKRFPMCDLDFHYVDRIATTPTGKRRYYVSAL